MKKLALGLLPLILITACTTSPLPKDYSGPIATIQDSALAESGTRAQFYFLSEINGQYVDTILSETRKANAGRGFAQSPVQFRRDVPAQTSTLLIKARVSYGAPIQELANSSTIYTAERTLNVKLESNKTYVVKGMLSEEKKEVWLEEQGTGKRVD